MCQYQYKLRVELTKEDCNRELFEGRVQITDSEGSEWYNCHTDLKNIRVYQEYQAGYHDFEYHGKMPSAIAAAFARCAVSYRDYRLQNG